MNQFSGNKRQIGMIILLSILTCGIYYFVWLYQTTEMLAEFNQDNDTNGGMVVFLTIITCGLYGIYWWYKIGLMFIESQQRAGRTYITDNKGLLLILSIFQLSIIGMAIFQTDLNNFWDSLG